MSGDFTRETFHPAKHYSRVLFQQGRVTLDADPNEQTAILLHALRTLARDLIGPYAAPAVEGGFQIVPQARKGFTIGQGRYYVDGILVENETTCPYDAQPDYPLAADDPVVAETKQPTRKMLFLYLDVWERVITPIQDGLIREVALNGPDTALRAKVVWQVRALDTGEFYQANENNGGQQFDCAGSVANLVAVSAASLAARIDPGDVPDDPCILAPSAKYRGAENQLYRVQIHNSGTAGTAGGATFKWSRDNGSRVTAWLGTFGDQLRVADSRLFDAGCWVEMTDDVLDLQGQPGVLVRVAKVAPGALTLDPASVGAATPFGPALVNPKLRRWDQAQVGEIVLQNGAVPIQEGIDTPVWIGLEDGVQVSFTSGGTYRSGDYWEIPARVATGDVEWPRVTTNGNTVATPLPPRGVHHHYAPLGFLAFDGETFHYQTCYCEFTPGSSCFQFDFTNRRALSTAGVQTAPAPATPAAAAPAPAAPASAAPAPSAAPGQPAAGQTAEAPARAAAQVQVEAARVPLEVNEAVARPVQAAPVQPTPAGNAAGSATSGGTSTP